MSRRFLYWLVGGVALGVAVGSLGGARVAFLGQMGTLVIRMLRALATPLVFFAVADALQKAELPVGQGLRLIGICLVNSAIAGALAITLAHVIQPGAHVDPSLFTASKDVPPHIDASTALSQLVPESVVQPLLNNAVLAVVLLALLTGVALRHLRAKGQGETLARLIEEGFQLLSVVLSFVIRLVPLAVFGVVAQMVGTEGLAPFRSLLLLCVAVMAGLAIHVTIYYSFLIWVFGRRSPWAFWRASAEALLTALSTGSSAATLPVTLKTLETRLGVSAQSARLAACIGTNFNNDGIMLYEVVAALFIAQAVGIHLGPVQLVLLAATSALAAAGIAGIPEAGLITLSLVLSAAGLPLVGLPLLLSVDWILGRLRATTNVASDLTVATVLDRFAKPSLGS